MFVILTIVDWIKRGKFWKVVPSRHQIPRWSRIAQKWRFFHTVTTARITHAVTRSLKIEYSTYADSSDGQIFTFLSNVSTSTVTWNCWFTTRACADITANLDKHNRRTTTFRRIRLRIQNGIETLNDNLISKMNRDKNWMNRLIKNI